MARFVLVHGAFHGGWCWRRLAANLEAAGHTVDAVDLPGHGSDPAPIASVTLTDNARRVAESVEAVGEPVIVVAHSLGGMAVAQAAEYVPDGILALVYVAALLPRDGQAMADLPRRDPGDPVDSYAVIDQAAGTFTFAPHAVREIFYGECSQEIADWAAARLEPESLAVIAGRVDLSANRGAQIPRFYIECRQDRSIRLARQRAMYEASGCIDVLSLDADHSPFLSRPRELADHLATVAAHAGRGRRGGPASRLTV